MRGRHDVSLNPTLKLRKHAYLRRLIKRIDFHVGNDETGLIKIYLNAGPQTLPSHCMVLI